MTSQGVSRSDSEMQQKSWPIMAPALAAAAWKAEMPGMTLTAMRAGLEVDDLVDQRRHGIDARHRRSR